MFTKKKTKKKQIFQNFESVGKEQTNIFFPGSFFIIVYGFIWCYYMMSCRRFI